MRGNSRLHHASGNASLGLEGTLCSRHMLEKVLEGLNGVMGLTLTHRIHNCVRCTA